MEEKVDFKMGVHQMLVKNGFYRLPMHSLSEILKLLEMEDSVEPKAIQQNAIAGLLKVVQKYGNKCADYINSPKHYKISSETKSYVQILLQDTIGVLANKNTQAPAPQMPPLMPPGLGSIYPPIANPLGQYNYLRSPHNTDPSSNNTDSNAQQTRYLQETMKMQQQMLNMYYYSIYGGMNPMLNPHYGGFNNYMSPYSLYGQMLDSKGMPTAPPLPIPGMPPSQLPSDPYFPKAQGSLYGKNDASQYGRSEGGLSMQGQGLASQGSGIKANVNGSGSFSNQLVANQASRQSRLQQEINSLMGNSQSRNSLAKEPESLKSAAKKQVQTKKYASQVVDTRSNFISPANEGKKIQKKKNAESQQRDKVVIQNPPFLVGEKAGSAEKNIAKDNINRVGNMEPNYLLKYCACKGSERFTETFLCAICNRTFHFYCLNQPLRKYETKQPIQCYHCRLRFIDPLNKVKEVIAQHYITNIIDNKFSITCNLKPYEYLCRQKNKNQIEMRCLKVSHAQNNEITWPDQCFIKLNGEKIIEIPALQMNSSLKKRKDYSIMITQNVYSKINDSDKQFLQKVKLNLEIKPLTKEDIAHKKIKNNYTFAFAIYFIEKLTVDQLFQRVLSEEKVPEVPNYIQKLMNTSEKEVQIDKISVSIKDPFTFDLIKMPVRGHKCNHGQCFDLQTFISFMHTARNRSWKCPVCSKDSRKFMIDSQQLDLIKQIEEGRPIPSQITFMKNGKIVLKIDKQSEDEGDSEARSQKTKKIMKSPKHERSQRDQQSRSKELKKQKENQPEESKKQVKEIVVDLDDDEEQVVQPLNQPEEVQKKLQ